MRKQNLRVCNQNIKNASTAKQSACVGYMKNSSEAMRAGYVELQYYNERLIKSPGIVLCPLW